MLGLCAVEKSDYTYVPVANGDRADYSAGCAALEFKLWTLEKELKDRLTVCPGQSKLAILLLFFGGLFGLPPKQESNGALLRSVRCSTAVLGRTDYGSIMLTSSESAGI